MSLPTQPLEAFLPYVLQYAPNCPPFLALPALRMAAIELCVRGRIWRHVFSYALAGNGLVAPIPAASAIHEIESAWLDGVKLTAASAVDVDEFVVGPATGTAARWIHCTDPDLISVFPAQTGTLKMSVFLKPKHGFAYSAVTAFEDANNYVPTFMLTHHADDIAAGALSRVLLTPGQPFTNPEAAGFYLGKFNDRCEYHAVASVKGQQGAPMRIPARWL